MKRPRFVAQIAAMSAMRRWFLAVALAFVASAAQAQDQAPKVTSLLVVESASVVPGGRLTVALEENIRAGWHTYWVNPGDVGSPTLIKWTLPPGWSAGPIQWPTPKRLPVSTFMDYGYEGDLWLLSDWPAPADVKPGTVVPIKAEASWLVCEKICVPEEVMLTARVTVGDGGPDPAVVKAFAAAGASLPVPSPGKRTFPHQPQLALYAAAPALVAPHPADAAFFPLTAGAIKNTAPQKMGFAKNGLVLRLEPGAKAAGIKTLQGVLVLTSSDGSVQALNVDAPPGVVPDADFPAAAGDLSIWLAMGLAFLGGLILN